MQTSQKQLTSGKLGWGWTQAVQAIAATALSGGCFVLLVSGVPVVRSISESGDYRMAVILIVLMISSFVCSRWLAKSILTHCRQNLPFSFSGAFSIAVALFCVVLLVILNLSLEQTLSQALVGSLWSIEAAVLLGIFTWLSLWTGQSRSDSQTITEQDLAASEHLSVIAYSDRTVLISPNPRSNQPSQFNSMLLFGMGLFFWTMLDLPTGILEIAVIACSGSGLVGISTWQIQLQPEQQIMALNFTGLWDLQATYTINLRHFPRLQIVKLSEGDLTWVQLSGQSNELALPGAIIDNSTKKTEDHSELAQILLKTCRLARHETSRDSLGLIGLLLPQGTGILAGVTFSIAAVLMLLLLPLPNNIVAEGTALLIGTSMLCPALAKRIFKLVAPTVMPSDPPIVLPHFHAWEIGTAIILSVIASSHHQKLGLIALSAAWISFGIGVCILALVRRTPINIKV